MDKEEKSKMQVELNYINKKIEELSHFKENENEKYQKHCYLQRMITLERYKEILELQIEFYDKPAYESKTGY